MPSSTVEDYLKTIYTLQQRHRKNTDALVPMGELATAMKVAPGTATAMVKTLHQSQLVRYEPRTGVSLTTNGQQLALHVLRRHRLVELLLVDILKLDWSQVHDEAEQLEHAISDTVLERIDDLLGHPRFDPHGDPIPTAAGTVNTPKLTRLADCTLNEQYRIARIVDQNSQFLQFADRHNLTPGTTLTVTQHDPHAQTLTITPAPDGTSLTIAVTAATKILVQPPPQ